MSDSGTIKVVAKTGSIVYSAQPATITLTSKDIIDAMDVVGFQDQGRDKVVELIQDKFQDLLLGKLEVIPNDLVENGEAIMEVVNYLSKIFT